MWDFPAAMLQCTVSMPLITLVYACLTPLLPKRYAAKWRYMAWLVIAAGWAFPFRPQADLPFLFPQSASIPGTTVWQPIAGAIPFAADTRDVVNAPEAIPVWPVLAAIWILGIVSFVVYHALGLSGKYGQPSVFL
jgi:beta-lactamase regulating signal transducer with metallopeptidase domain